MFGCSRQFYLLLLRINKIANSNWLIDCGIKRAKEQTIWCQRPGFTAARWEKSKIQKSVRKKKGAPCTSTTEHIVIRCWQRDVWGKEEKAAGRGDPVATSKTTANHDRALISLYTDTIQQTYIYTVSHSDDFSIYKLSPGQMERHFSYKIKIK